METPESIKASLIPGEWVSSIDLEDACLDQCFRLRTNVRKFTPKSSDLGTYYLPGGQTDTEVFVKKNIDILSIYKAILYLFQFQNKNG